MISCWGQEVRLSDNQHGPDPMRDYISSTRGGGGGGGGMGQTSPPLLEEGGGGTQSTSGQTLFEKPSRTAGTRSR